MPDNTLNTIITMRGIISGLRRTEIQNAELAGQLAEEEIRTTAALNNNIGNVAELAQKGNQLAGYLHQFDSAGQNAARQLANVEEMLVELENQLR